jgi:hypothetical protein
MKRRNFLKGSLAASTLTGLSTASLSALAGEPAGGRGREYYELRAYRLKNEANRTLLDGYLQGAALPAWNRLGIKHVGVFVQHERTGAPAATELVDPLAVLVLIPYPSLEMFSTATTRLNADAEYQKAGATYLRATKSEPAFNRIDSWLMLAFAGMPRLELPSYSREKRPRLFELRTYESHSELKALKKVEMFNAGEIQLMRDVGLAPVFYGQALIGANLPHLTYLLSAENDAAHKKHWDAFKEHATWKSMSADPQYADTVSHIANRFLAPAPYSQI